MGTTFYWIGGQGGSADPNDFSDVANWATLVDGVPSAAGSVPAAGDSIVVAVPAPLGGTGTLDDSGGNFVSNSVTLSGDGPVLQLTDAESLCAFGRFCDPHGQVWNQVAATDDPEVRATFVRQVGACPAGRLVAWDKATGRAVEPVLPVSIGLVEDPVQDCSGPLWLRGGVAVVAADGFEYEVRNRVTLCRCGASSNKPFCDGSHASVKFKA